ncbi:hypothetical protein ACFYKT_18345 [Cytobacillus sp. FJAT-53684]|uniref:Uncharacterized protein n=1 Tax=Cytobacillus mangrovibacter TaxID=3299024 RepID=A0ABW6K3X5_9BACI
MKSFNEIITKELIERIVEKLTEEARLIDQIERNSIIYDDYNEIEPLVIADISNYYFQIPLLELEE